MLAVLRSYFFKMDIDEFTRIKVVEKEITNGQKENNFYESILIYIDYIDEKAKENILVENLDKRLTNVKSEVDTLKRKVSNLEQKQTSIKSSDSNSKKIKSGNTSTTSSNSKKISKKQGGYLYFKVI